MEKVKGLGGIFFKCADPAKTKAWYAQHLGIPAGDYGHSFMAREQNSDEVFRVVWSPFPEATDYFEPGKSELMVNYRVENLEAMLKQLAAAGAQLVGEMQTYPYGKFAWVMDPDGRKVELWEPVEEGFGEE